MLPPIMTSPTVRERNTTDRGARDFRGNRPRLNLSRSTDIGKSIIVNSQIIENLAMEVSKALQIWETCVHILDIIDKLAPEEAYTIPPNNIKHTMEKYEAFVTASRSKKNRGTTLSWASLSSSSLAPNIPRGTISN